MDYTNIFNFFGLGLSAGMICYLALSLLGFGIYRMLKYLQGGK